MLILRSGPDGGIFKDYTITLRTLLDYILLVLDCHMLSNIYPECTDSINSAKKLKNVCPFCKFSVFQWSRNTDILFIDINQQVMLSHTTLFLNQQDNRMAII